MSPLEFLQSLINSFRFIGNASEMESLTDEKAKPLLSPGGLAPNTLLGLLTCFPPTDGVDKKGRSESYFSKPRDLIQEEPTHNTNTTGAHPTPWKAWPLNPAFT